MDQATKEEGQSQLHQLDQEEMRSDDAVTTSELALLTAVGEATVYYSAPVTKEVLLSSIMDPELDSCDNDSALLCSEIKDESDPSLPFVDKIKERLSFSNFLVCPIKFSYKKMYDTTALVMYAS